MILKILTFLIALSSSALAAPNAEVRLHSEPESSLLARLQSILSSQNEISIEAFYLENDSVANFLLSQLANQKKQWPALNIRIVTDAWGSSSQPLENICYWKNQGLDWKNFNPSTGLSQVFNQERTHRKIWLSDTGLIVGGRNLAAEHFKKEKLDWDLEVKAEANSQILAGAKSAFQKMWSLSQEVNCSKSKNQANIKMNQKEIEEILSEVKIPAWHSAYLNWQTEAHNQNQLVAKEILRLFKTAKQSLILDNAYFIPPRAFNKLFQKFAQKKLDMSFYLSGPQPNLIWQGQITQCLSAPYQEDLISQGVQIYHPIEEVLHSKAFLIDGQILGIGSFNLDYRSANWNIEDVMVATEAPELIAEFKEARSLRLKRALLVKNSQDLWKQKGELDHEELECRDHGQDYSSLLKYFF